MPAADSRYFESIFADLAGPSPRIPEAYLKALRCAANAWLKANPSHPHAALVKAALVSTNPQ